MSAATTQNARPIDYVLSTQGPSAGIDSTVDFVFTVDAALMWDAFGEGPRPEPGIGGVNGLSRVSLELSARADAGVMSLSLLQKTHRKWQLPDLSRTERLQVAFRVDLQGDRLPVGATRVDLARVTLQATSTSEDGANQCMWITTAVPSLPVLVEDACSSPPVDPEVASLIARLAG